MNEPVRERNGFKCRQSSRSPRPRTKLSFFNWDRERKRDLRRPLFRSLSQPPIRPTWRYVRLDDTFGLTIRPARRYVRLDDTSGLTISTLLGPTRFCFSSPRHMTVLANQMLPASYQPSPQRASPVPSGQVKSSSSCVGKGVGQQLDSYKQLAEPSHCDNFTTSATS